MVMEQESKYYVPSIEIWKDVIGYENEYEISSKSNIPFKI
jgi:hypothetical protein